MDWKKKGAAALSLLVNFFIPKTCLSCKKDQKHDYPAPLCADCIKKLRFIEFPYCALCGTCLPYGGRLCYGCRREKRKRNFVFSRSAVMFGPEIREVIHAYKYHGYKGLSSWFAGLMAERMVKYPEFCHYELIVPVPVSARKKSERGFDHTWLLAELLALGTGRHFCGRSLFKCRETKAQAGLGRAEREKNLSGSFSCRHPEAIRNQKIILVDDVATTLSTLHEASGALMEAGAADVACYTLARE